LSVCLSYASGAFCVAWSWTPTVVFESLGLRYMCPHVVPTSPHEQHEGEKVVLLGSKVDSPTTEQLHLKSGKFATGPVFIIKLLTSDNMWLNADFSLIFKTSWVFL